MRSLLCLTAVLLALPIGSAEAATTQKWPGDPAVAVADPAGVLGDNVSGLSFDGPDVLWAVKSGPGTLYRLVRDGSGWRPAGNWPLRYRNGEGDPDAEGVVRTPDGVLVATERDNDGDGSLLKVLRYARDRPPAPSTPPPNGTSPTTCPPSTTTGASKAFPGSRTAS